MNLEGKRVTIIGLARSGIAIAELALRMKAKVKISDHNARETKEQLIDGWSKKDDVQLEWGEHSRSSIEQSDLVIISPGVRIDAPCVQWAKEKDIPVIGEVEFAFRFCPSPIVAVTGTNGKTTVSTLIKEILTKAGRNVCLCGNIGTPLSKYVFDLKASDIVVMEISSFQLESIVEFKPFIAVFLNFSQNHLDRHKDQNEYFETKKRIFMNQAKSDYAVLNSDDPLIKSLAKDIKGKVVYFNEGKAPDGEQKNPNHLAALAVANILNVPQDISEEVLNKFPGVEHRLELVRTIDYVDFVNDSKSTTVEAGRWALNTLTKPIVMICGGRDKNSNFLPLKDLVSQKVKTMILIGEARKKIKEAFQDVVPIKECDSLKNAVQEAKGLATKGDCVALSPMCASFDMFENFEQRGHVFKKIVNGL